MIKRNSAREVGVSRHYQRPIEGPLTLQMHNGNMLPGSFKGSFTPLTHNSNTIAGSFKEPLTSMTHNGNMIPGSFTGVSQLIPNYAERFDDRRWPSGYWISKLYFGRWLLNLQIYFQKKKKHEKSAFTYTEKMMFQNDTQRNILLFTFKLKGK